MDEIERELIGNVDAQVWAKRFVETVREKPEIATDEGTMIGWFANAIMSGWDDGARAERKAPFMAKLHEVIFQSAGAAAGVCLPRNQVFPAEQISEAVNKVIEEFGIPAKL